jgi:8-oxo-dGTP pyrophosphatase MutT (NUDIX family)
MTRAGDVDDNLLPASTLLLVRDTDGGIEVFMVRRPGAADFGGMYVFPGGKVDAADADAAHLCANLSDAAASSRLGIEAGGLAYWVAAIRESFEEAGVLLARRAADDERQGDAMVDCTAADVEARYGEYRQAMHDGQVTFTELCDAEGLQLAADAVHYFSHWITPKGPPRRYDTRFFLARMPENQRPTHHEEELTDGVWIRPANALEHHDTGLWRMIVPTLTTLRMLVRYSSVDRLTADVAARRHVADPSDELNRQGMQQGAGHTDSS